jgi:hypothetical protein
MIARHGEVPNKACAPLSMGYQYAAKGYIPATHQEDLPISGR